VRTNNRNKNEHNRYLRLTLAEMIIDHPPQIEEIKIKGKPSP